MSPTAPFRCVLPILLACLCANAESTSPPPRFDEAKLAAVPELMRKFVADNEVAGAVTLMATRDRVVQLEAVGKADVANDVAMKPDALFWIASMTKPVTATAILMLQDEGKLSVNDPVAKYLPELAALKGPDGKPAVVTLKHLLTHTSGMVSEAPAAELQNAKTLADLIPLYAKVPLNFEPGTKWAYCQSGINSLGRVVEVVSGKSVPDFFQERIFGPLGMKDTTFYPTEEQAARLAKSYKRTAGKLEEAPIRLLHGKPPTFRDRYPACNGGLFTTATDYGRFCQMLLNDGTFDGHVYLKPETVKAMRSPQSGDLVTGFTPGDAWGLGVCIVREPQGWTAMLSPGTFGHGGAYGTQAWIDPVKGIIYVLMVQRADFPNSDASPVRKGFQQAVSDALQQ
jgi:CubicO group peptidase (beta-lactamase class C family)